MLAVPALVTSRELLTFLSPGIRNIRQLRIIRDQSPNQYMVLITFRSQVCSLCHYFVYIYTFSKKTANRFYEEFDGKPFNSIEPELCRLVYVDRIETSKDNNGCLPIDGCIELPTCAVCLERMDESVDAVLTVLCNHSFHSACLSQWGDTR